MKTARTLKQARNRAGLSQSELAGRAGVLQPAISRIERGVVEPSVGTLNRLLIECGESLESMPRLGLGIDRTLLREALSRTPGERLRFLASAAQAVRQLRGASPIP